MKTIVEALKDLYVALGGKEQDVANLLLNPDVIEKIAAAAGDAVKPELPALTGNAGKVLKVDSDAEGVEWAEAGGGGFVATFTTTLPVEDGTITDITCDKTYEEVMEAVQGEGASFRLIDNLGRVTPSCGYYIDGENLVIVVNIFGIPNNTFATMDVAGLNILYSEDALTAEYAKAWIGLQGG